MGDQEAPSSGAVHLEDSPAPQRRGLRSRAVWILADQAVSSIANAGLTIVIAQKVSPQQLGAFAVAFTTYTFAVALTQSVAGQVVIIGYSGVPEREHRRVSAQAAGVAVGAGVLGAIVLLLLQPIVSPATRPVLLALAFLLPPLLLQDLWRTAFISRGDPKGAFVNDVIWTGLQVVFIAFLLARHVRSAAPYLWAWGLAALAAAAFGCRQNGSLPQFRGAPAWLRHNRRLSVPTVGNTVATLGSTQIAFIGVASLGSVAALGAIRGAQTLLGPLNILHFAASAFAVPELVRRELSAKGLLRAGVAISAFLMAVDLLWGGALLLIPDSAGAKILGDSWGGARAALPGLVLFLAALGATTGALAVMRAVARTDLLLWSGIIAGPLMILFAIAGVRIAGGPGAAYGFAIAAAIAIPPTWMLLARAVRSGSSQGTPVEPTGAGPA